MTLVDTKRRGIHAARAQLVLGFVFLVTFTGLSFWARLPVPYRDDWDWLLATLTVPPSIGALLTPHNEHLIPLPRLIAWLQYRIEGSGQHLMFGTALAAQILVGGIVLREIRRRWPHDRLAIDWVSGLALVPLFVAYQLQSTVFAAAMLFPLVQAFAVTSIICVLNATDPSALRRACWLAAAVVPCAGALLTTTNGLVVPVVLALLTFTRRGSRSVAIGWAALALGSSAGYLWLIERNAGPPLGVQQAPAVGAMAIYFLAFFGSFVSFASVPIGAVFGALLLVVGLMAVVRVVQTRASAPRLEHFAASLLLFAVSSGVMATLTRAQHGPIQAAQSRYATYAMLYWTSLVLVAASRTQAMAVTARFREWFAWATVMASVAMLAFQLFTGLVWKAKSDNIAAAAQSLAVRLRDDEWVSTLHPVVAVVYDTWDRLAERGDRLGPDGRLGAPFGEPAALTTCPGTLRLTSIVGAAGFRVTGTAFVRSRTAVIVDRAGVIRGFARLAPLVSSPNPSQMTVIRAVWQALTGRRGMDEWLGFLQEGAGPPYLLFPLGDDTRPICRAAIDLQSPSSGFGGGANEDTCATSPVSTLCFWTRRELHVRFPEG